MTASKQETARGLRIKARTLYAAGEVPAAIAAQRDLIEATRDHLRPKDFLFLGLILTTAGDFEAAGTSMREAREIWPDDPAFIGNLAFCEARLKRWPEALALLSRAVELSPEDANLHDGLAGIHGNLGDLERARVHGETSLRLKDALTAARRPPVRLSEVPVPDFRRDQPARNVIAFSLWGRQERYCRAALENARVAPHLYPEWRCRFYCDDSVPGGTRAGLLAAGAEVVLMARPKRLFEGLFWRFLVANDPEVDRFLVRDCDSLLNLRERRAVEAWTEGGAHFHVMRDYFTHSELILAGLWGGVRGALPELPPLYQPYLEDPARTRTCDQRFLREVAWPIVRQSHCSHDSLFRVLDSRPFPAGSELPAGRHVGQDMAVWSQSPIGALTDRGGGESGTAPRRQMIFALAATASESAALAALLEAGLPEAEVHHSHESAFDQGLRTPDGTTIALFNTGGNLGEVRDFWRRKLAFELYGKAPVYAETSHLLAACGLIENLDLLPEAIRIDIVALQRPAARIVGELAANDPSRGRLVPDVLGLSPGFARRLVTPERYLGTGFAGTCLWYVTEMAARAAYYRRLLKDDPRVRLHRVELDRLAQPAGAAGLLTALGAEAREIALPAELAATAGAPPSREIEALVARIPLQAEARARAFLEAGRRLGPATIASSRW